MKLLSDRIETLLQSIEHDDIGLEGEAPAEALDALQATLANLRQAIKDAVVDAYIEARGERK